MTDGEVGGVAVVDLGRQSARGARQRVATWRRLWEPLAPVSEISLLAECRARPWEAAIAAGECLRGEAVPETLVWSRRAVRDALARRRPDVVVFTTLRSYHPAVAPPGATVVIDYVDQLSQNYRERASIAGSRLRAGGYRALAGRMADAERRAPAATLRTAAGWHDARVLDADWVPILIDPPRPVRVDADVDVVFVGTLDYSPNVEALRRLWRLWPRLRSRCPTASLLVAGANPVPAVRRWAAEAGWELVVDFDSLSDVCPRARIAVAPVAQATGIQCKVLETASYGLPQVVDPSVVRGLGPDFPVLTAVDDDQLVDALARLIDDPPEASGLGERARRHVLDGFTPAAWRHWGETILQGRAPQGSGAGAGPGG